MRLIKSSGAFASLFVAPLLASSLRADQVVLKNGDRVTGAVVKKDGKNLTVKTDPSAPSRSPRPKSPRSGPTNP